ncbi:OsmC family protein [Candidatus Nitrosocosmicus sp. T]
MIRKRSRANPVEYALAALNGCITTTLIYHAVAQGIKIEKVEFVTKIGREFGGIKFRMV